MKRLAWHRVAVAIPIAAVASAVAASLALAAGPPSAPPPKPAGRLGPPPAWVGSTKGSIWLAYGSYCWSGRCVDYLAPALRARIPVLRVQRGTVVRLHFGFMPRTVSVGLVEEGAPPRPLVPAAVTSWRPTANGRFEVQVAAGKGNASYIGSLLISSRQ